MGRNENISKVCQIVCENHQLTVRNIVEQANIDRGTIRKILTEGHVKMVPKQLAKEQKQYLASKQITMLEHLPCSLDLAPSDFLLFLKIKEILKECILMTLKTSGGNMMQCNVFSTASEGHMSHVSVMSHAHCEQKTATIAEKLFFEQRKAILKWYWKYENIKEVRQWQSEFGTWPPTCRTRK
ncbi:hypothetical protein B7P43_G09389 [Cryptotermes secundus]|uniref:Uncharacterized protein n=1 Tax=Cryptotermes secundus TaxID=105785 RepID=A0A2J7QJ16_9NEOP|nr:hypothetical protein B7P43_G09389 [Cryptotermes secundus]